MVGRLCLLAVAAAALLVQMSFSDHKRFFNTFLDILFPPTCTVCGEEGAWVCSDCIAGFAPCENNRCPLCAKPFYRGFLCLTCRDQSALSQCCSSFAYTDALKTAVHAIKFGGARLSIPLLIPFLCDTWRMLGNDAVDCVMPIPLHVRRERERGYNQAELFARGVAEHIKKPLLTDILIRTRETKAQAELSREERRVNTQGAFSCRAGGTTAGASVLLIDDVCTTGATLEQAARTLREAGAREVNALTLAHG